jgi:Tfp pilus assembly protein PilF
VIEDDYGTFLYQTGHNQAALSYFLKAANNPDNLYAGEAYQNAALAELRLHDPKDAAANFKEAALQDPELKE